MRATREFAALKQMAYQDPEDVCPDTELVYRHAGLRKDAKQLYLDIKQQRESRVELINIISVDKAHAMLDSAGLIIQSCGFSSNFPALFIDGQATHLSPQSQQGELSDAQSEKIIEGLFAIGLGVQVTPAVDYRGEASFDGAVNSLQIYPLSAAPLIISKILQRDAQPMCG